MQEVGSGDERQSGPDSEEPQTEANEVDGRNVTLQMVKNWVHNLEKVRSSYACICMGPLRDNCG